MVAKGHQKIGRYEVISEIGHGGMAVVYLAFDPNVGRQVAIKVIARQFTADPIFRSRFRREAEVIAKLEYPAIVPIYDFGEYDGQPYLVMRYMAAGSLADRIERGPLPLPETARILERLAPAMDEAHSKGIIHRDLKPGNILFDLRDQPYLCDFGIVKLAEGQTTSLTARGLAVGTPAYMSPEQVLGQEKLDGRSDVYALGAILFQMLTGRQPYQSDTPMGMAMMHVVEPPPIILEAKPDLPPGCQTVINRAMAKDREERYPTAAALAAALSELAASDPEATTVTLPPAIEETTLRSRRALYLALAVVGIAAVCLSISAAVFFAFVQDDRPASLPPSITVTTSAAFTTTRATKTSEASATLPPSATPVPSLTATSLPSETPESTVSESPIKTPTRAATPTPKPTDTQGLITTTPPDLVAPEYGVYGGITTFEWRGVAGVAYQVNLRHKESGLVHLSPWIGGFNWSFDLPGDQFGDWEWFVTAQNGARSKIGTFVNDPFPNKGGDDGRGFPGPPPDPYPDPDPYP